MTEYDEHDDIRRSVIEGFNAVLARVAKGGPGWGGYGPCDRFNDPETIRKWPRQFDEQT